MVTDAFPHPSAHLAVHRRTTTSVPPGRWGFRIGLATLAALTALLTIWAIDSASESTYYAAITVSMSQNPANFFFGAFDPAGTVTLDKIPGSFWIPALFVAVFGYSTWAVALPNALAAVASVAIVALTARRLFSPTAGLIAGAVVATTPILVAVSRSNQPESFFVLCLALVAWAAARALTRRSFGWLIITGLFIALAFQTYMLEAWAVWPALAAAFLATATPFSGRMLWRRIWQLGVAGVISLAASVVWIAIVSLIPADQRPYIGSTLSNNPWEMVFGYNGLGRFSATANSADYLSFTPPFSGNPSAVRLFTENLAGQIAWLLPAALLAVVVLWMLRFSRPVTVFLGVWLLTFGAMFSAVAGMHQFYTASLAIPAALLVGLAFGVARRRGILWPQISLIVVAAVSAVLISLWYPGYSIVVSLIQVITAAAAVALLLRERARQTSDATASGRAPRRWIVTAIAAIALVLTPAVWSAVTVAHPNDINPVGGGVSAMPHMGAGGLAGGGPGGPGTAAGSAGRGFPGGGTVGGIPGQSGLGHGKSGSSSGAPGGTFTGAGRPGQASVSAETIAWLQQNRGDATYLIATFGAQTASGIILATDGGSVLPIGGFNNNDAVPTLARFQALVADGSLRYVLGGGEYGASTQGPSGDGTTTTSAQIRQWVEQNCERATDAPSGVIYDCAP